MYTNFTEYWEMKKGMYTFLGITKEIAHTIWCDCANLILLEVAKETIKKR